MAFFGNWCESERQTIKRKRFWKFKEKAKGRQAIRGALCGAVRAHYDVTEHTAQDVAILGYEKAAAILRERLPRTKIARSGELGEILASELVVEELGFKVPVRRLRYKDGREMALRGDDFIGVRVENDQSLWLLKGEAKSRVKLEGTTIAEARATLNRDDGRCTPISLLFVADRLMEREGQDAQLGRAIRNEIGLKSLPASRIDHVLFTFTGNAPPAALETDLKNADATRNQTVINLRIPDHQEFIADIYDGAADLGNS